MKKRIFMLAIMVALIVCALTVVASADTIVPSSTNEFGALTTFDTAIGRTDIGDKKDDNTIARTVLFDGTNYYTVPTVYLLTKGGNESSGVCLWWDFSGISSKLGYTFTINSVIRTELPSSIDFLDSSDANKNQYRCFNGFTNVIEIKPNEGLSFIANGTFKAFASCKALTEIDVSMMNFNYAKSTYALFEYCDKLVTVTLPEQAGVDSEGDSINYETDYMFNGCKVLATINNIYGFMSGTTKINQKTFNTCNALENIKIWDGVTSIGAEAFRGTKISSIVIPESVTSLPNHVFADCKSLQKVAFSSGLTSVGNYCFEKNTALTDIWFPSVSVSFAQQVFGQVGASKNINLYFPTSSVTVTFSSDSYNNDPVMNALVKKEGTDRIKLNTPLSTKCSVFIGDHTKPTNINSCLVGGNCSVCSTAFEPYATEHTKGGETLTFPNGLTANGIYTYDCTNPGCTIADILAGDKDGRDVVAPVFTAKGYSTNEDKNAINGGYSVDLDSLTLYERLIGELNYGIVIANANAFGANSFFNAENKVNTDKALQVEMDKQYASFDCSINFGTKTNIELDLVICAYVIDANGVTFIQAESGSDVTIGAKGFKSVTLAQVVALQPAVSKED